MDTQDLAKQWRDWDGFAAEVSSGVELFARAYSEVKSCMRDLGDKCHAAYTRRGVGIAVLYDDYGVAARALVYPAGGVYVRAYGYMAYALETLLRVACGLRRGSLLEFFDREAFTVKGYRQTELWAWHPEIRWHPTFGEMIEGRQDWTWYLSETRVVRHVRYTPIRVWEPDDFRPHVDY